MPKTRFSDTQRYSGGLTSGMNSVNKAQRKKLEKTKFDHSLPKVPYSDIYFRSKNIWVHKGKCCMRCHAIMDDPYVLEHHHYICEVNIQKSKNVGTD